MTDETTTDIEIPEKFDTDHATRAAFVARERARIEDGECANCGRVHEDHADMDICPFCCDHHDVTRELTMNWCEVCHTRVEETDDGWMARIELND